MKTRFHLRTFAALALAVGMASPMRLYAQAAPEQQASASQLKAEAYEAFKGGDFDKTSEILKSAATLDPSLTTMSAWIGQFQHQREELVVERRKQFDKAVSEVQLLMKDEHHSFAIDRVRDAYLLADDKEKFRSEQWVDSLIKETVDLAAKYEADKDWFKALRLYSDLSAVEPNKSEWSQKLKIAQRRIRLLAIYTPDQFKEIQESESKARQAADALLNPTTQPTTQRVAIGDNEEFKIRWNDILAGVKFDMLREALDDARSNFWKTITYPDLLKGGIDGLTVLVTTPGLEKAFPGLADETQKTVFLAALKASRERVDAPNGPSEQILASTELTRLREINKQSIKLPEEVLVNEFADGAFAGLDPYTQAFWPYEWSEFNKGTSGEFPGVGIQIQTDDNGDLKVVTPIEDSPAYKMGIKAGDVITAINGKNAKGITGTQAVKHITGPAGSPVTLSIRSIDGTQKDYVIKREIIKVASVKGWRHQPGGGWDYMVDPEQKVAYMRLATFSKTSTEEVTHAIADMKAAGARAIIFDLRHNPGGLLTAASEISDKFLSGGLVVSTRADRPNGAPEQVLEATASADDVSLPMVVLVNQYSASASEIVSGALKDHHRATIIGERTYGKGSVQMLLPLARGAAYLKVTTSHYYLPSGRCLHREEDSKVWGVDPDLKVEMTPKQMADAIDARSDLDVLHDAKDAGQANNAQLAAGEKRLMDSDPQLSASLLLLKLQLAGGA